MGGTGRIIAVGLAAGVISAFLSLRGCDRGIVRGCKKTTLAGLEKALVEKGIRKELADKVLADERLECYSKAIYEKKKQPEFSMSREEYANGFLKKDRIRRAKKNLKRYAWWFKEAERRYGVKKEVIAAILEVESKSGKSIGDYNAPSAFASIFQNRKDRRGWAAKELAVLISFAEKNGKDPFYDSSPFGAMGIQQFLPSTAAECAKDADGNGFEWDSMPDAIFSVANYLKKRGWESGGGLEEGSKNWRVLRYYNQSDNYVYVIVKLAGKLE